MKIRFYFDPETGMPHIYKHGVKESEVEQVMERTGEDRPGRGGSRVAIGRTRLSKARPKEEKMSKNKFPPGWDEERVRRVLAHYEDQSEEEALAEDEAAFENVKQTTMEVPIELLPMVRELLAKYQP